MLTLYSETHIHHRGADEWVDGKLAPYLESPERAFSILDSIRARQFELRIAEPSIDAMALRRVHDGDYVDFVADAWNQWVASGQTGHAVARVWPLRERLENIPASIDARLGIYSCDSLAPIMAGTFTAALDSANVAVSAADALRAGVPSAFALCRPPGHHAGANFMGGYCYFNNSAIAAQRLLDMGSHPVAILDVDYHHGNGTQDIFYARSDVLVASIHADPTHEYPFFGGYASECGTGAGTGFNLNLPLPMGSDWSAYHPALQAACSRIRASGCDALVVSLGLDTAANEPISTFRLETPDYEAMGTLIGQLQLPTVVVLEGGYAMESLARNALNVLDAIETQLRRSG